MDWEGLSSKERSEAYRKLEFSTQHPQVYRMTELLLEARNCVDRLEALVQEIEREFPAPDGMRWSFHLIAKVWILSRVVEDTDPDND